MKAPPSEAREGLELRGLEVSYRGRHGRVCAVRGVDLRVEAGEAVGLFGESGCGKSSLVRAAVGLLPEGSRMRGEVRLDGERIDGLLEREWRRIRGRRIGMVFQQPSLALHPLRPIGSQLADVYRAHLSLPRTEIRARSAALFEELGLEPEHLAARPHQLSGGQQQRACLALALAAQPSLLIADEPTTALDSATEGRVLELLGRLHRRRRLSLLVISHDPEVLARVSTRLYGLYAGRVVEEGPTGELLKRPRHPYLKGLLACRQVEKGRVVTTLEGESPDPTRLSAGCAFEPRCPRRQDECSAQPAPTFRGERRLWCWNPAPDTLSPGGGIEVDPG